MSQAGRINKELRRVIFVGVPKPIINRYVTDPVSALSENNTFALKSSIKMGGIIEGRARAPCSDGVNHQSMDKCAIDDRSSQNYVADGSPPTM